MERLVSVASMVFVAGVFVAGGFVASGCSEELAEGADGWKLTASAKPDVPPPQPPPPDTGCPGCIDIQPRPDPCDGVDEDGDGVIDENNSDCPRATAFGATRRGNIVRAIAVADSGAIYVGGSNLGVTAGQTTNDTSTLMRLDPDGSVRWGETVTTGPEKDDRFIADQIYDVATDDQGRVYVAGEADDYFAGGDESGGRDGFVASYTAQGDRRWIRPTGIQEYDRYDTIDVRDERVVAAGHVSIDYEPETPDEIMVATYSLDGDGEVEIEEHMGADERPVGVAVDPTGGYFLAGRTNKPFQGGEPVGGFDAFLSRYDTRGTFRAWANTFGSPGKDAAVEIAWVGSGRTVAAGYAEGGYSPPGAQQRKGTSFIVVYDGSGSPVRGFAPEISPSAAAVAMDLRDRRVVTVGRDPGDGTGGGPRFGGVDAFIMTLSDVSRSGPPRVEHFGTAGEELLMDVALGPQGELYAVTTSASQTSGTPADGAPNAFFYRF